MIDFLPRFAQRHMIGASRPYRRRVMAPELRCKVPIGMSEALRELGVLPADVLAAASLPPQLLATPGPRVSVRDYFALWQAIRDVSGDPNIGITLCTRVRSDLTEPLFLAVLSAADVAAAVEIVARYKRIMEPQDLYIRTDHAAGRVVLTLPEPESDTVQPQILIETQFAFSVEMCRRGTGVDTLGPSEMFLRIAALDERAEHAHYFGCPIRLGAEFNQMVFSADDFARPFRTYNPQLLSALIPYLNATTPPAESSPIARARAVIGERLRGQRPTVESVSKELALSTRALQRVLRDNGTSFRQLLDDVRNEHARRYLSATSFDDDEVAFLLGFEEATSFYRAFRGWNGITPTEYRRRLGLR